MSFFGGFREAMGSFKPMLHGTGILTYIYHKSIVNVGKYSIHGSDGQGCLKTHGPYGIPFEKRKGPQKFTKVFSSVQKMRGVGHMF